MVENAQVDQVEEICRPEVLATSRDEGPAIEEAVANEEEVAT